MIQQNINQIISVAGVLAGMNPSLQYGGRKAAYLKEKEGLAKAKEVLKEKYYDVTKDGKKTFDYEGYAKGLETSGIQAKELELAKRGLEFEPEKAADIIQEEGWAQEYEAQERAEAAAEAKAEEQARQEKQLGQLTSAISGALSQDRAAAAAETAQRELRTKQEELRRSILQGTPSEYLLRKGGN